MWSGISDCDETYNYWEPAHQLLYGQGMQTWEYDPQFALRSYFYIILHLLPGWAYAAFAQPNPMLVFYFLRFLLAPEPWRALSKPALPRRFCFSPVCASFAPIFPCFSAIYLPICP